MRYKFILNEVFSDLRRHLTMTCAMILTTAISLSLFGAGMLMVRLSNRTTHNMLSQVEVLLFLDDDISSHDPNCRHNTCEHIISLLKKNPDIVSFSYLTPEQVKNDAVEHIFVNNPQMQKLVQDPDFALPATIKVTVHKSEQIDALITSFTPKPAGLDEISDQRALVGTIKHALNSVRNIAYMLALFQGIAALLLLITAVQMAAQARTTEMRIMSIVGAPRWHRQLPFILESMFCGIIGAIAAISGIVGGKKYFITPLAENINGLKSLTNFTAGDIMYISPIIFGACLLFSVLTGYLTLRITVPD